MIGRQQRRRGSAVRAAGEVGLLVSLVAGLIVDVGATPALADAELDLERVRAWPAGPLPWPGLGT